MDMKWANDVQSFVKEKPWVAVGVVGGVGAVALFAMRGSKTQPVTEGEAAQQTNKINSPLQDMEPGYPAIVITAPPMSPANPPAQTVPDRSLLSLIRDGRIVKVTAGPPGICPDGYASAQQPGQKPRCTRLTDVGKQKGERLSYFPNTGKGPNT